MIATPEFRLTRFPCSKLLLAAVLLQFLAACSTLPAGQQPAGQANEPATWQSHLQYLDDIDNWALRGRLNIRQTRQNDTVNINWSQSHEDFDIRLSGSLGMGAVAVYGNEAGLIVEKAGEAPVQLDSLEALSQEYLSFDFPASHLLFWVRGLPVPELPMQATWNEQALLNTLIQTDEAGQRWELSFDRYLLQDATAMPGRIRLTRGDIRLTFLISEWELHPSLLAHL